MVYLGLSFTLSFAFNFPYVWDLDLGIEDECVFWGRDENSVATGAEIGLQNYLSAVTTSLTKLQLNSYYYTVGGHILQEDLEVLILWESFQITGQLNLHMQNLYDVALTEVCVSSCVLTCVTCVCSLVLTSQSPKSLTPTIVLGVARIAHLDCNQNERDIAKKYVDKAEDCCG